MNTSNRYKLVLAALLATGGLAACGSGSDDAIPPVDPPPPPPPPAPVVFSDFVKTQFDQTANDTNPQEVDGTDFAFDDTDDPDAFDDLLTPP